LRHAELTAAGHAANSTPQALSKQKVAVSSKLLLHADTTPFFVQLMKKSRHKHTSAPLSQLSSQRARLKKIRERYIFGVLGFA
jgi:hypothetical protein